MERDNKLIVEQSLLMRADCLQIASVTAMPVQTMEKLAHIVRLKECYANAFRVANLMQLDVVFGAVLLGELAIEHAWVAEPLGQHFDPTLQLLLGPDLTLGSQHFELYRISMAGYLNAMIELNTKQCAIDMLHLRRSPTLRRLFGTSQGRAASG